LSTSSTTTRGIRARAALPTAYAPMVYPYHTGSDLYFLLTVHNQYNVILMRTPL
ncbi:DUF4185 domain-containing protein, partial [Nocardia cyriacigeorgica]|uniref:DUF4185 domain-containing protein n=1 Tax=Nocardia cyriacigeorgica TaxID=135487 RepID=UPI0013BB5C0B|nr:DUF4185 domain-containing protein [Nocardia cyriacigeorgica]